MWHGLEARENTAKMAVLQIHSRKSVELYNLHRVDTESGYNGCKHRCILSMEGLGNETYKTDDHGPCIRRLDFAHMRPSPIQCKYELSGGNIAA
jgi:hypothetical protein